MLFRHPAFPRPTSCPSAFRTRSGTRTRPLARPGRINGRAVSVQSAEVQGPSGASRRASAGRGTPAGSPSEPTRGCGPLPPRGRAASPRRCRCRRPPPPPPFGGPRGCARAAAWFAAGAEDLGAELCCGGRAGCGADGAPLGGLPGGGGHPPYTRPPRQWRPHDRAHQRIIAARDISADTSRPGGGVGGGTAWHCSGPRGLLGPGTAPTSSPPAPLPGQTPSRPSPPRGAQGHTAGRSGRTHTPSRAGSPRAPEGRSAPAPPLLCPSSQPRVAPRSPRVRRARRRRGTLARTPQPGRRRRLTCPSGRSACPVCALRTPPTPPRVCHRFPSKEQASFNFMAAVTIHKATAGPPRALSLKGAVIMRPERHFTGAKVHHGILHKTRCLG
ncbi:collagen alpha-1(I) chain-like [Moschus berezovskii]|uniref:collagen alpha-1(I) chain-like n=1 Tax=Moschus berezovskii TaxID=68408 RepID=UPI002443E0C5|nr:collagen alpha-1(I) chain-like [Moschus berezovskii]